MRSERLAKNQFQSHTPVTPTGYSDYTNPPKRRISLVISSLRLGGAQRVLVTMANEWARQGHSVSFITNAGVDQDFYALSSLVRRKTLNLERLNQSTVRQIGTVPRRIVRLRRSLQTLRPDVVISFCDRTNLETLIAMQGTSTPVLVSERTNPSLNPQQWPWPALRRVLYPKAHQMVAQTEAAGQHIRRLAPGTRVTTIPNPIRPDMTEWNKARQSRTIVALGRFAHCKGLDVLVAAFAQICHQHPGWKLQLVGEGPEQNALQNQIANLQMQNRIQLIGKTRNPEQTASAAEIYVLPSRMEGFPNSLLEAMAVGCPCIAADCNYGPAELIQDGTNGLLVPVDNSTALATQLDRLMKDGELRQSLSSNAIQVRQRYSLSLIMQQWDTLIEQATSSPSPKRKAG